MWQRWSAPRKASGSPSLERLPSRGRRWPCSTSTTAPTRPSRSSKRTRLQPVLWQVDVRDGAAVASAPGEVARRLGGECRHLVYAAGMGSGKFGYPFWNLDPEDWAPVLEVNLIGAVRTLQSFAPQLRSSAPSTALLISSIAGQIGSQTDPPYSAAKAGLLNFMQCAAKDLARYDVRVNAVCPGMIRTSLNRSVWQAWHDQQPPASRQDYEQWTAEKIHRTTPLGRWQTPEDVAGAGRFLGVPQKPGT